MDNHASKLQLELASALCPPHVSLTLVRSGGRVRQVQKRFAMPAAFATCARSNARTSVLWLLADSARATDLAAGSQGLPRFVHWRWVGLRIGHRRCTEHRVASVIIALVRFNVSLCAPLPYEMHSFCSLPPKQAAKAEAASARAARATVSAAIVAEETSQRPLRQVGDLGNTGP
jgi:hypothetical protein